MTNKSIVIYILVSLSLLFQSCDGYAQKIYDSFRQMYVRYSTFLDELEPKEIVEMKVIKIVDGDTFDGLTKEKQQVRVRLAAFDAPEKGQPYGKNSKQKLSELIFGKDVIVVLNGKSHYSRMIATVFTKDSVDVVAEMLRLGMGWHFKRFDSTPIYSEIEEVARNQKVGLWHKDAHTPIAPWDWRKMSKEERDRFR